MGYRTRHADCGHVPGRRLAPRAGEARLECTCSCHGDGYHPDHIPRGDRAELERQRMRGFTPAHLWVGKNEAEGCDADRIPASALLKVPYDLSHITTKRMHAERPNS